MVTKKVKVNVTHGVKKWKEALADAEERLEQARREIAGWKGAIRVCRKRISEKAPWPGDSAANREELS